MANENTVKVGAFEYDTTTNSLVGPAEYMRERGDARLARIAAGQDTVFNYGSGRPGASTVTLTLVSLQTDYAAWRGTRDLLAGLRRSR